MSVQPYERYIPLVKVNRKATADEVTANKFTVAMPYIVTGCLVNHRIANGTTYTTAQKVEIKVDETTKACVIEVSGTAVTADDTVHILAWA